MDILIFISGCRTFCRLSLTFCRLTATFFIFLLRCAVIDFMIADFMIVDYDYRRDNHVCHCILHDCVDVCSAVCFAG